MTIEKVSGIKKLQAGRTCMNIEAQEATKSASRTLFDPPSFLSADVLMIGRGTGKEKAGEKVNSTSQHQNDGDEVSFLIDVGDWHSRAFWLPLLSFSHVSLEWRPPSDHCFSA